MKLKSTATEHHVFVASSELARPAKVPEACLIRTIHVVPVQMPVLVMSGKDADAIGEVFLQKVADEEGLPIVIDGYSEHHGEKIFHPAVHALGPPRITEEAA